MKPLDLARIHSSETEGAFERFEIPSLILRPVRRQLTGALKLVQGSAVRMIGFSSGGPTVAASSLAEERLGPLLELRGALSPEQISVIDEAMRGEGLQFGAAAIKVGALTKMDLARWLKEQHAYVITQSMGADSVRATFGPLGKLTASRSGLQLLAAIEAGVREYPVELRESLQQQLDEVRFVLPAGSPELAHELGCSQSVAQILKMQGGESRSLPEYLASSEDDDPDVPVLTLVLTGLAVPESLASRATPQSATARRDGLADESFQPAGAPSSAPPSATGPAPAGISLPDLPPAPREGAAEAAGGTRPVANVDDLEALLKNRGRPAPAPRKMTDDVDDLLSGLSRRQGSAEAAPARAASPVPLTQPASSPNRALDHLFEQQAPAAPMQQQPAARSWPAPGQYSASEDAGEGFGPMTPVSGMLTPGMPIAPAGPAVRASPHGAAFGATGAGPAVAGVPGQPGAPYAGIPKELLAAVQQAQRRPRTGTFLIVAVLLVLSAVGGGAGTMYVLRERSADTSSATAASAAPAHPDPAADATAPEKTATPPARPDGTAPVADATPETTRREGASLAAAGAEGGAGPERSDRPGGEKPAKAAGPSKGSGGGAKRPDNVRSEGSRTEAPNTETPKTEAPKPRPAETPAAGGGARDEIKTRLATVRSLLQQGDHRGVLTAATEILRLDPRNAMAYRSLGIAYSALGARSQACESYRRYLLLASNPADKQQIEAILTACN